MWNYGTESPDGLYRMLIDAVAAEGTHSSWHRSGRSSPPVLPNEAIGMQHPIRERHAVAMAAAGLGARPCRDGAQQQGSCGGERENDGAGARMRYSPFGLGDHAIDAPLGVRAGQSRRRRDELDQIGAVVSRDAAVAGRRQQYPPGLGAKRREIDIGWSAGSSEQMVDFRADDRRLGRRR